MLRDSYRNCERRWDTADTARRESSVSLFERKYPAEEAEQREEMRKVLERWKATLDRRTDGELYGRLCRLLEKGSNSSSSGKRANKPRRLTEAEKSGTRETVVDVRGVSPLRRKQPERGPVTPSEEPDEKEKPPIRREELDLAEKEADRLQAAAVSHVQRVLDSLAGRKGLTPQENKEYADRARKLAKRLGVDLLYNGQPVYYKWTGGVFTATTTDSAHGYIDSSAEFLPLTALPKGVTVEPGSTGPATSTHAEKVRQGTGNRGRRPGSGESTR